MIRIKSQDRRGNKWKVKIVIDPITRIEGHLRAEVEIDEEGIVQEAYVSGQLFRGIEIILKNRDPEMPDYWPVESVAFVPIPILEVQSALLRMLMAL